MVAARIDDFMTASTPYVERSTGRPIRDRWGRRLFAAANAGGAGDASEDGDNDRQPGLLGSVASRARAVGAASAGCAGEASEDGDNDRQPGLRGSVASSARAVGSAIARPSPLIGTLGGTGAEAVPASMKTMTLRSFNLASGSPRRVERLTAF